jgi:two-component system sensor histidine kinase CpxA
VAIVDLGPFYEADWFNGGAKSRDRAARRPKRLWKLWKTLRGLRVSHKLPQPLLLYPHQPSGKKGTTEKSGRLKSGVHKTTGGAERLDELIGEILSYARLEATTEISRRKTDLADLVQTIVDDADVEGRESGKQIRLHGPETVMMDVDTGLLQRAVENVVRNALKHTIPQTTVEVTIVERPGSVEIVVRDRGPGVPEVALDKLFDAFYRVEDGRGTHSGSGGIGLAIAQRSIQLHGGTIRAVNCSEGGLRIEIALPR